MTSESRQPTRVSHSLFFRSLRPPEGWDAGRAATSAFQHARLLDAIATAVGDKGYSQVTLADIVGLAGVSRRTFYEHFEDKEACFLAAYETGAQIIVDEIRELPQEEWRDLLAAGIGVFLTNLAENPGFARTFLVDVVAAGPKAIALRQRVLGLFVENLRWLGNQAGVQDPSIAPVSDFWLWALVGGMSEVVERHILDHGAESLPELEAPLVELATVMLAAASPTASRRFREG